MKAKTIITLNSTLLYALAFMLSTCCHELAHAIAGLWFESGPILHHNYVEHTNDVVLLNTIEKVFIALAGPLVSLLLGLLSGIIFLQSSKRRLQELFLLWFAIIGLNNFLGYLMTGPIFTAGDIGKVYQLLEWSITGRIVLAILAAGLLLLLAYKLTRPFLEFSVREEWINTPVSRKSYSFRVLILPWIMGSLVVTFLYLPIVAIISIIYPITSGMIFIYPWQNAVNADNISPSSDLKSHQLSFQLIWGTLISAIIFKFILAPGIAL